MLTYALKDNYTDEYLRTDQFAYHDAITIFSMPNTTT